MFNCAICGEEILTQNPRTFFCRGCYRKWKSDIVVKTDWVRFCVNDEHHQRRLALRDRELIYLGNQFDLGDLDGEYRLVFTEEYCTIDKTPSRFLSSISLLFK